MNFSWRRMLVTVFVVGVVLNVYDYIVHDVILLHYLYRDLPIMRYGAAADQSELLSDSNVPWFVLTDFIGAALLTITFVVLRRALPDGLKWSLAFGAVLGTLMNVPLWWVCSMQLRGFPARLAIAWTLSGLGWMLLGVSTAEVILRNPRSDIAVKQEAR